MASLAGYLKAHATWRERDKAVFRSLGRSLELALSRTEDARQLAQQNLELEVRIQVFEHFAGLARTQETEITVLMRQA
ncbi:hypothetical protein [Deinococcus sp. UYEF24]